MAHLKDAQQAARLGLLHGSGAWRSVGLPPAYGDGGHDIFLSELDDSKGFAVVYREVSRPFRRGIPKWNYFGTKATSKTSGVTPAYETAEEAMGDAENWLKSR